TPVGTRRRKANPPPRWGSSAAKPKPASAIVRARIPGVSNEKLSGTIPAVDQRSLVNFKPALPVIAAGKRTEAALSVPKAKGAEASQGGTLAPLDGPPGSRCGIASQGLRGLP